MCIHVSNVQTLFIILSLFFFSLSFLRFYSTFLRIDEDSKLSGNDLRRLTTGHSPFPFSIIRASGTQNKYYRSAVSGKFSFAIFTS